jgi:hypothetical protein
MPSEADIKAKIAAAIAAKKKTPTPTTPTPKPEPKPEPSPEPKIEIKLTPPPPVEMASSSIPPLTPSAPPPVATPTTLIFGGRIIRFTIHQKEVYFSVADLLQLARDHEWNHKLLDFVNNPKTKKDAEDMIKVLTFKNEDGSDKTEGATAQNAIKIFHGLGLRPPGPLGRWLTETSAIQLANKQD